MPAATVGRAVTMWAGNPHLRLVGGTGPSYPSFTVEADSARTADSRWRGVLALYASPHGGPPALEVRIKRMCRTPLQPTALPRPPDFRPAHPRHPAARPGGGSVWP